MTQHLDENELLADHDLDADAVCQECETVNTPGTLICRKCGNNLRDQKARRLAALAAGEADETAAQRRQVLSGLLSVFGILAILWVGINFNNIVEWMTAAQTASDSRGGSLWRGTQGDILDEMAADLRTNPPSPEAIQAAQNTPATTSSFDGRYAIGLPDAAGVRPLGVASVRVDGTDVYYCALLDGAGEIRGVGSVDNANRASSPLGAMELRGDYMAGVGFAQRADDGTFTIVGQADADSGHFRAVAYRLAE